MFRCLLHNDVAIAEFLGVYHQVDVPIPALIFAGKLMSVRNFIKTMPPDKLHENKLLVDILAGLQYIHSKGLVHLELTRDTVTVSINFTLNTPSLASMASSHWL